jgi:predicted transposase/invertase (TIGR01784 family)
LFSYPAQPVCAKLGAVKTDSLFYRIFQTLPGSFFSLIGQSPEQAEGYQFRSVEIKQTAFRIDGIFLPSRPAQPVYFVEVQFQEDPQFYARFFSEIFLYLRQYPEPNDWRAVVIFPSRNVEPNDSSHYRALLNSNQVLRIYLNEIDEEGTSMSLGILKLVVEPETTAAEKARRLLEQVRSEPRETIRRDMIELIETVVSYKFASMSKEEIEAMLTITESEFKQSRLYKSIEQEGKREGKLETVPEFLKLGLSLEQIAQALHLPLEEIEAVATTTSNPENS